jgi:alpha-L-rhamnosidase
LDKAYTLLEQKSYPSWLYPVTMGATTIWERWDGIKPDSTFQSASMNSFNHYAYGAIGNWMYTTVAGINIDEQMPGYKRIIIAPQPGGTLTQAMASHNSMYGEIISDWTIDNQPFQLKVDIPPNTTAYIILPQAKMAEIEESNQALTTKLNGIVVVQQVDSKVRVEVGSGSYTFTYKIPN